MEMVYAIYPQTDIADPVHPLYGDGESCNLADPANTTADRRGSTNAPCLTDAHADINAKQHANSYADSHADLHRYGSYRNSDLYAHVDTNISGAFTSHQSRHARCLRRTNCNPFSDGNNFTACATTAG